MSVYQVSCPARALVLDHELRLLDGGGFEMEPSLWCALEADHPGLHHAYAQALKAEGGLPASNVWLRWQQDDEFGPLREMLILPSCPEKFLAGTVQEEGCCLPEQHHGRHGFEFGPPLGEADITPDSLL